MKRRTINDYEWCGSKHNGTICHVGYQRKKQKSEKMISNNIIGPASGGPLNVELRKKRW